MAKKEKIKIYEYIPEIYPRRLWVIIGGNTEEVNKEFCYRNGSNIEPDIAGFDGCTIKAVRRKDKKYGEICWFPCKKDASLDIMVHEACHAAFDIFADICIDYDKDNQEPFTYFIQYISECIFKSFKKR